MYQTALLEAGKAWLTNWRVIFLHIALLLIASIVVPLTMAFGMAGGFAAGLLLALLVSCYLGSVASAVDNDRLILSEVWPKTAQLFGPVIGVMFIFFLFDMLFGAILQQGFVVAVVGLLMAVLFNVLPEVIYQRTNHSLQLFADSFEFMRENFVEWLVPFIVVGLPLFLISKATAVSLGFMLAMVNPIRLLEFLLLAFHATGNWVSLGVGLCIGLGVVYYVFIFRGVLYRELAASTRRKRIYQERMY